MSGTLLAPVWDIAPRIVAQVLGLPFERYSPQSAGAALGPANFVGTVSVWITADPKLANIKPFDFKNPVGYAAVDPALVRVGDYLRGSLTVGGPRVHFFIASMDVPAQIQVVYCNATVSVLRPSGNTGIGAQPYGGDARSAETPIITSWPASLLQGTKGEKGDTVLPGDVRMPWQAVMLPAYPGAEIETADVLNDDLGRRYKISSAENSARGWRLTAMLSET